MSNAVTFMMNDVQHVQAQIEQVEQQIKHVEEELSTCTDKEDKLYLRNKEEQLRKEKEQLREKENILLRQQNPDPVNDVLIQELKAIRIGQKQQAEGMQQLLIRDKEVKGGFSTASRKRNARVLQHYRMALVQESLPIDLGSGGSSSDDDDGDDSDDEVHDGDRGGSDLFVWTTNKEDAPDQRKRYMQYIRNNFSVTDHIWVDTNGEVTDSDKNKKAVPTISFTVPGVYELSGTTDVLLIHQNQELAALWNIEVLVELKKEVNRDEHQHQVIVELLAHGELSSRKRIVALLTDLKQSFTFYWFEMDGSNRLIRYSQEIKSLTKAREVIVGLFDEKKEDYLSKRCSMPPIRSDLPSIPESFTANDSDGDGDTNRRDSSNHDEDDSSLFQKDSKRDSNRTKPKSDSNQQSQSQNINKYYRAARHGINVSEDVPGANLRSLMGEDPLIDLDIARELARTIIIPGMTRTGIRSR